MKWLILIVTTWNFLPDFMYSFDVNPQTEAYIPDYNHYHNLTAITSNIADIVAKNPSFMRIDWSYKSKENRPQILLHITNFTGSVSHSAHTLQEAVPKIRVLLSYGEHAREFIPIESLFYLLQNLTSGLGAPHDSPEEIFTRTILSKFNLYIIVMANPDGRKIVEKTKNYCWRGTSTGVDLNRNFDWEFGNAGSSNNPKDEEYRGKHVFSEIESKVYTELTGQQSFDAFISFHSGIRQIYLPYADTKSKSTVREPPHLKTMTTLAEHLSVATKYKYSYGKAYDLGFYTADGTIFDYIAGKKQVPISMAIELWGKSNHKGLSCFDQFNPKSRHLKQEVADIHPLYVSLFFFLIKWKQEQFITLTDSMKDVPSMTFGYILLIIVIFLTFFVALQRKWCPCTKLFPRKRVISLKSLSSTITVWGFKSSSA
ncbi:hypothetical protein SNE40_008948 [Patella caerulea]|uniref:Peptidase M14 domain-containing protein n=1 Tax=Patella caerulea TaxID=87958 RepID=A0AAN8JSH9_PATCE